MSYRRAAASITALAALTVAAVQGTARADGDLTLAPGVTYQTFSAAASHGPVRGYEITVDLRSPHVSVDLLHPPTVSDREPVSQMADAEHAIAGVNGDFFNISEEHPGVVPTNSSVGPEITHGLGLKFAVPDSQRFGPGLPPGTSTRDVVGVGLDRRARLGTLTLRGSVLTPTGVIGLAGVNQYAVRDGGVAAFTPAWGSVSRERVVCGSDAARKDPCRTDVAEVVVRHGIVASVSDTVGSGPIAAGSVVLVGRDRGADALRRLHRGEPAFPHYWFDAGRTVPFAFAVGGFPILRHGSPLPDLDTGETAPRTAAGISADGRRLYLVTVDGRSELSGGYTVKELAAELQSLGASDGVNLDGGGSSTMVSRAPGQDHVVVDNVPSDGTERPVANGIGVFTR